MGFLVDDNKNIRWGHVAGVGAVAAGARAAFPYVYDKEEGVHWGRLLAGAAAITVAILAAPALLRGAGELFGKWNMQEFGNDIAGMGDNIDIAAPVLDAAKSLASSGVSVAEEGFHSLVGAAKNLVGKER